MNKVILKLILYISVFIGLHLFAAYQADGSFDDFYMRFTNGQHQSMIVGTSRAAQGLCPSYFDEILGNEYAKMGNFAFTLANSPYGKIYYEAIQKKIDTTQTSKKQLFIVTVDPWAVSSDVKEIENNTPRENDLTLGKVKNITIENRPNFEYLTKMYAESWGKILFNPSKNLTFLHQDGWLEVNVPMDDVSVQQRTAAKIVDYKKTLQTYNLDKNRLTYLDKTVAFLQQHGTVYLVRLPTSESIIDFENELSPNFDDKMAQLAQKYNIRYISLLDNSHQYQFVDGNHLYKASAKEISKSLANQIKATIRQ